MLELALTGKSAATQAAYRADLERFAQWAGFASSGPAIGAFLELGQGDAHAAAIAWRGELEGAGFAPRTVARKLAALRRVVRIAHRLERVTWLLDVESPKIRGFVRPNRGPPALDVETLIAFLADATGEAGAQLAIRDHAIVLLLHDSGLRCTEALSLDVRHVDLAARLVNPIPKGPGPARIDWPVSPRGARALGRWLRCRGKTPGPLFCGVGIGRGSSRLTRKTVWRRVVWWAEQAGLEGFKPHGLRKAAAMKLQRATGDLERVRRFMRHVDPATTTAHYLATEPDDIRADVAVVTRSSGRRK